MEIEYGNNATPAAVLNLVNGDIYSLDGQTAPPKSTLVPEDVKGGPTAKMFAYLGGELRGANGRGGKGWIPDNEGFLQCGVLRVDFKYPKLPEHTLLADGRRILVTAQNRRVDHRSQVIIVDKTGTEVFFVTNRATAVRAALYEPDKLRHGQRTTRTLKSYAPWGSFKTEMTRKEKQVTIYGMIEPKLGMLTSHRVLDLVFWDGLYYPGACRKQTAWEGGLGLVTGVDGALYFNTGGILRAPVKTGTDLTTRFGWATFVTDPRPGASKADLYIVDRKGKPTLIGRYPLRDGTSRTHYMVQITPEEADAMKQSGTLLPEYVKTLKAPPVIV